ncbi:MAG: YeiH family protein [Bacteroidia bacterium]
MQVQEKKSKKHILSELNNGGWAGVVFVMVLALAATYLSTIPFLQNLSISPLIVGILLGMILGNSIRQKFPEKWSSGIVFSAKKLLRLAIILYGFRITFQQIGAVGFSGMLADVIMLSSTFLIGAYVGIKWLKIDRDIALLTASGASVCGAAAVLATEPVLKSEPYKTTIAVATVVLFGTLAMFLYPVLYKLGLFQLNADEMGIYIGATVHEVAQVVASGNAISPETADTAVIVKMTRVMLLVPLLLLLSIYVSRQKSFGAEASGKTKIRIPWFAVAFIGVSAFNSLSLLPINVVSSINIFDTFLLTMAMTALGLETRFSKFKQTGGKPVLLALIMFVWLLVGGYFVAKIITSLI